MPVDLRPVYINGYSHLTALGDEGNIAKQAQQGIAKQALINLEIADIPAIHYYQLPTANCSSLISRAIENSSLPKEDLLRSHYLFGTSSMSIGNNEAETITNGDISLMRPDQEHQNIIDDMTAVGPIFTFNTACTSSANALLVAQRMIATGIIEHAVIIGIDRLNKTTLSGFSALQLLSNKIKPFDRARKGVVLGDAISVIILTTEPHHEYHYSLLGGANQGDTHSPTGTDEAGQSITQTINEALLNTQLAAEDIGLIKAQAAGSPTNDLAEANGLKLSFSTLPPVTSLKPYIGHTLGASGCSELSLLISCFRAGFIPACPGFNAFDEGLAITPLTSHHHIIPRYTLLNHFGFGGNNTVLVLESGH